MRTHVAAAVAAAVLLTSGCGPSGGNGEQAPSGPTAGIGLPRAIEVVPAKDAGVSAARGALTAAEQVPADSAYAKTETAKVLAEPTLRQLDILNALLDGLSVAHHDDPAVVNQGPYSILVPWLDDPLGDGRPTKRLSRWVVDSRVLTIGGRSVNRVQLWPADVLPGAWSVAKVQLDIHEAPRRTASGSYADYGVWSVVALFDDDAATLGHHYFAADIGRDSSGRAVIRFDNREDPAWLSRGVVVTSGSAGEGWLVIPEGGVCYCTGNGDGTCSCTTETVPGDSCRCIPPPADYPEWTYAFDAETLTVRKDAADPVSRDRNVVVDFATRLGVFDATTGDVAVPDERYSLALKRPGSTDRRSGRASASGVRYSRSTLAPGETLVLRDPPVGQPSPLYTVSATFDGYLMRTDFIPATVADASHIDTQLIDCSTLPCNVLWAYFDAQGWHRRKVLSPSEWGPPVFDPGGDEPYDVAVGVPLRVNGEFFQYEVTRTGTTTWDVKLLLWRPSNVANAANFVPAGVTLGDARGARFRFDTDPASETFLKLVYEAVPADEAAQGVRPGDVVGGRTFTATAGAVTYQFEWSPTGFTTHYLMQDGAYVPFEDDLVFLPVPLRNHAGLVRNYVMSASGSYAETPGGGTTAVRLWESNGVMSPDMANAVVTVPNGTEVVAHDSGRHYLLKQLHIDQYLLPSAAPHLGLGAAAALRGRELPGFVAPEPPMGAMPDEAAAPLTYVAGEPVK